MRSTDNGTTLCLLLALLVACGDAPPTKPPARAPQPESKPKPTSVVVEIEASLLGKSAAEMEQLAALPLEDALSQVDGVEALTTTCTKQRCVIRLRFVTGRDAAEVRPRVEAALGDLNELPEDASVLLHPLTTEAAHVVLRLTPSGDTPPRLGTLRRVAETIVAPQLKRERGVSEVVIRGGHRPQCVVSADPNRLASYDVTPLELAEVLEGKSARPAAVGPPTRDELLETVVVMRGKEPVRLRDLANVRIEMTKSEPAARRNVSILVTMAHGTNADTLQAKITSLARELPKDVRLETVKPTKPTISVWLSHPKQEQPIARIQEVMALVVDVPGVTSATPHRDNKEPELVVELKHNPAASLGITKAQVGATIQIALAGRTVGSVLHDKQPVKLVFRLEQQRPKDLDALTKLRIRSQSGGVLPVSSIADFRPVRSPSTIFRLDRRRAALVTVKTTKDANPETVVEAIRLALAGRHAEIYVESHGQAEGR